MTMRVARERLVLAWSVALLGAVPSCKRSEPAPPPLSGAALPPTPVAPRPRAAPKVEVPVAAATTGSGSWRDELIKEAGDEPVLFTLLVGDSVVARTPSGGFSRKLVTGGVGASWDAATA